jgi:ubiquinone/menaquinone biosynthesis C-methylase UbiE
MKDHDPLLKARSYDDVAGAYEHINAPLMFGAPARALVECARLQPGELVLDVGSGTGAVARAAIAAGARVVATDPSLPMLEAAARGGVANAVAGSLPYLPFGDALFERVCCAFVMTHLDDPDAAAEEMRRVLRPGGGVALSAWAPADDDYSTAWNGVVREFVAPDVLAAAALRVLPADARFSQRDGLAGLLEAAGFSPVQTTTRTFEFCLDLEQMIATRDVCASGRALRALLTGAQSRAYGVRVREVLGRKFPDGIRFERSVYIALGFIG